jgi:dTDP-4-dehydrorhamnose reductase
MSRTVVTGASGLLGAAVLAELGGATALRDAGGGATVTGEPSGASFPRDPAGAEGWSQTVPALPDGTRLTRLDLTAPGVAEAALRAAAPALVVHCAALTDVDRCEAEPAYAHAINADAPRRLAAVARELGARFVHISTDAVYDGEREGAHAEGEPPQPANAYARTKLEAEEAVLAAHPEALVLRTTMHGWTPLGRLSFSESILRGLLRGDRLTLFYDVTFSPLVVSDHARLIVALLEREATGILNLGASDAVTKENFGRLIAREFALPEDAIEPISLAALGLAAPRPRNTAMDVARLTAVLGAPPPSVADGIRRLRATAETARPELQELMNDPARS